MWTVRVQSLVTFVVKIRDVELRLWWQVPNVERTPARRQICEEGVSKHPSNLLLSTMTDPQADALSFLRKESLDIYNRLHSISEDIAFVTEVHEAFPTTPILRTRRSSYADLVE